MRGEIHTEHEAPEVWHSSLSLTPEFLCSSAEQVQCLESRPAVVDPVDKFASVFYPSFKWMSRDCSNEASMNRTCSTDLLLFPSFSLFLCPLLTANFPQQNKFFHPSLES